MLNNEGGKECSETFFNSHDDISSNKCVQNTSQAYMLSTYSVTLSMFSYLYNFRLR